MTILALTFSIAGLIITGLRIIKNNISKEIKEENKNHFKNIETAIENLGSEVKRMKELKQNS
jgi:ferritin-like protein